MPQFPHRSIVIIALAALLPTLYAPDAFASGKNITSQRHYIAQRFKTYQHNKSKSSASPDVVKGYAEKLATRIQESWESYNIKTITARVALVIGPSGNIVSTKLINSTGPKEDVPHAIESITYATPFGKPPGNKQIEVIVNFRLDRVSVSATVTSNSSGPKRTQPNIAKPPVKKIPTIQKPFNVEEERKKLLEYLSN